MTPAPKLLTLLLALPLAATSLHAQSGPTVVFNDNFDVGAAPTFSNDADAPTDTLWNRNSSTSFTAVLSNDAGGPLAASGNSALLTLSGTGTTQFKELNTSYTELSLAVGEKLEARFTLRLVSPSPLHNKNDQIRVVLGNVTGSGTVGTGYAVEIGTGTATASTQFKYRSGSAAGSGATSFLGTHTFYGINDYLAHNVIYSITRTSDTEVTLSYQLDGNPAASVLTSTGVTAGTPSAFDRFGITAAQGPFAYRIDDLQLVKSSAIPSDTDSDGLDDNWETLNFGSLTAQDGTGDPDADLATNEQEETAGSNPNNARSTPADTDADSLPDSWETTHFSNLTQNGTGDADGDLATNAAEFAANTDPSGTDGLLSWPDTDSDTLNDAWEVRYFTSIADPSSTPESNPDGDAFTNKQENDGLSDPTLSNSIPGDVDGDGLADAWEIANFSNLAQTGSGDFDNDRATNEQEETAGSDPKLNTSWPDADSDFLNDAWEIFYFTNIAAQDGSGDPDADSFSNDAEHFYNFNPTDPFSSPDLDTDGLADGWEVFYFTGTSNDGSSDPDADGFNNTFEFGLRTNPNLATSVPGDLDNNGTNDGPVLKPSGDLINTTSFANGLNWHNGLAPAAGQTYIVDGTSANGGGLRTSTTNADYTFAGDRIVFTKGGFLIAKHTGGITFTLAEFNGGTINQATNTPPSAITLNGAIQITGTTASTFWANNGSFVINAAVSGPADLNLTGNQLVTFNGALTGTGDLIVAAHATTPATNRLTLSATSSLTFTLGDAAATNTISGAGAVSLNGAFVINSAAVTDTTVGNSWALVSTTGSKTYGSTFSVLGYVSDGAAAGTRKWTSAAAPFFQFNEATGSLSIVTNPDSDADGLPDSWEITHFTNLDQTGAGDFDGDLATNATELAAGTNPASNTSWPDTDADGVNDAFEIATFGNLTTATITDRDGDTLLDAWETVYFGNTSTATSASGDNDADGATNAQEFAAGSDPDDAASKPVDTDGDGILDVNEAVKPYTVDADTLHLWHLNETSAPFANAVNTAHNLQGMFNGVIAWTPSLGGFGTSVNTNSGTTPNFGIVTYAPTLDGAITGDTATPADPAFVWQGADGAFTLEAVVKFDSLPTTWTSHGHLITLDGDGALTEDRVFQFRIDTTNPSAPALQFQRLNTATQSVATALPLTGDHAIDTTSWFHVAVTYDGSEGMAGNTKLYWTRIAPGVAAANLLGFGSLTSDFPAGIQGDLSIGNEARGTPGEPFRGSIDEVRISRIARTDTGFLFVVALSPYQSWAATNSLTVGVNDGATQDPDNDGLTNLLEYATGAANNPLAPTANPVTTQVITNVSSNKVLRLEFPRVNDPSLSYVVQATSDLATAFTDVTTYPAATTPVQHEDTVALTAGIRRFLRLEIRQN